MGTSSAARESFTTTLVTNAANLNSDNFDPVALAAAEVSAMLVHAGERHGEDDGLSGGAIAGIVIGVLCGVALLVGAVVFSMKKGDDAEEAQGHRHSIAGEPRPRHQLRSSQRPIRDLWSVANASFISAKSAGPVVRHLLVQNFPLINIYGRWK